MIVIITTVDGKEVEFSEKVIGRVDKANPKHWRMALNEPVRHITIGDYEFDCCDLREAFLAFFPLEESL